MQKYNNLLHFNDLELWVTHKTDNYDLHLINTLIQISPTYLATRIL